MAITPATRVSRTLHGAGMMTVLPGNYRREGIKVSNTASTPLGIRANRELGSATVSIRIDLDTPSLARERREQVIEILTAAGYRVEPSSIQDSTTLYVWEPNWFQFMNATGRAINAGFAPESRVEWRADRMRDGMILVHRTDCPAEPVGKHQIVTGRTREDIGLELNGTLIKKTMFPERNYKIVKLHDCITEKE